MKLLKFLRQILIIIQTFMIMLFFIILLIIANLIDLFLIISGYFNEEKTKEKITKQYIYILFIQNCLNIENNKKTKKIIEFTYVFSMIFIDIAYNNMTFLQPHYLYSKVILFPVFLIKPSSFNDFNSLIIALLSTLK